MRVKNTLIWIKTNFISSFMAHHSIVLLFIFIVGCSKKEGELFTVLDSDKSGVNFENTLTESDELSILDYLYFYNGGGVAIGDVNNDGLPDIFFSGNQVKNKLYLNQGNLLFKDITESAGVGGESDWNTGVVMGDVNGDGLLDIYVCAVVGIHGFKGKNELYINNGDNTFTEKAKDFGLDFKNYSSTAAFLDYDLDGDLDIYLLNQAIHNADSFGKASKRNIRFENSGDKLLRNNGNYFEDVSEKANIYGGANGYGLGVAISDFNNDGYPDIYVGNDFHEDDYYYLNNGDGTFTESLKKYFGHISKFSMGNDVADINHDGFPDIITLDMLPEDEGTLKSSIGDDNINKQYISINDFGYHYQYARNMLQLNNNGNSFTEIGLQSGISATDWSWSALFNDYNQDGEQDIFISNGIPKRPNNLDYVNFISNEQIQKLLSETKLVDRKALELMPHGDVQNCFFEGSKSLKFIDRSTTWIENKNTISNGAAYGDLDNDGDIDVVTNNLNAKPTFYINKINKQASYLKIKLVFEKKNLLGIGSKVKAYYNNTQQSKELYTARGFQSSSEPMIHFGFGKKSKIDSLEIIWPNKSKQVIRNVNLNTTLKIKYNQENVRPNFEPKKGNTLFSKAKNNDGLNFNHEENFAIDFNSQKLIPYAITDRGIATTVADINNDGKLDVVFGGSNDKKGKVFLQKETAFKADSTFAFLNPIKQEDVSIIIEDFNGDKKADVFALSGGGMLDIKDAGMQDRYYIQENSKFVKKPLPKYFKNGSVAKSADFDKDGDMDIFIGAGAIPTDFGKLPSSYILKNSRGAFSLLNCKALENIGIVTDAIWTDFDKDGLLDLLVVGEWMTPKFLKNTGNNFIDVTKDKIPPQMEGLWQSVISFDIDHDGDEDFLLGNWGLNSKFKASNEYPMKMFYGDFDNNGNTETIVAIEKNKEYYPLASLDELSSQVVSLIKKKFPTYNKFAGKTIYEIFDEDLLNNGKDLSVSVLESGYLKNNKGVFVFVPFKRELQVAPLTTFLKDDFTGDKKDEILVGGNFFGVTPFHGRFDGFTGALIIDSNTIKDGCKIGLNFFQKEVRKLKTIKLNNKKYLLVTINNKESELYEINN